MESEHAEEEVMPGEEGTPEAEPTPTEGEAAASPTPAPTQEAAPDSGAAGCDNNSAPTADAGGPYTAMMGKGEAFVIFDASGSTDAGGSIETYEWDFGDGNSATETEAKVTYGYKKTGVYTATLTVTDNCNATDEVTVGVTISGPTPPAEEDNNSGDDNSDDQGSATPAPAPAPIAGTQGFCYRVQYGDTLWGIATRFGVYWPDLARVNNVHPGYYVVAGQGLFVPTGEITQPPNLYEVQEGDTLNSIAYQCGLTVTALTQANSMTADDAPTPGHMMIIPPWRY
jgi:LysM repeat protein